MTTEFGIARLPPVILVSCNNATNACQFDVNGPTICQRGRLCKATGETADPCLPSRLQLVKFKNKSQALYLIPIQATVYEFWTTGRKHTTGQTHAIWHCGIFPSMQWAPTFDILLTMWSNSGKFPGPWECHCHLKNFDCLRRFDSQPMT